MFSLFNLHTICLFVCLDVRLGVSLGVCLLWIFGWSQLGLLVRERLKSRNGYARRNVPPGILERIAETIQCSQWEHCVCSVDL